MNAKDVVALGQLEKKSREEKEKAHRSKFVESRVASYEETAVKASSRGAKQVTMTDTYDMDDTAGGSPEAFAEIREKLVQNGFTITQMGRTFFLTWPLVK